ncbi:MAG: hypothetical protein HRT66_09600 [Flavobacteriaceae bacterium]|nr:hypothetical protein [Flavobacteriaceae bacterium]
MDRLIVVLIMLSFNTLLAQNKLHVDDFKGIWKVSQDSPEHYDVFKGREVLQVLYSDKYKDYFKVRILHFGFTKKSDTIYTLRESGTRKDNFIIGGKYEIQELGDDYMEIYSQNLFWFDKIKRLPQKVLEKLYTRCLKDKRNYIREFLEIGVRKITTDKTYIYKERGGNNRTNMYLVKGDIIEVISAYPKRVNFKYETAKGKIITGWVKKEDVSESLNKLIEASKK